MNIFDQLITAGGKQASGLWRRTLGWAQEERPLSCVQKVVIASTTDLVLCRGDMPRMLVASEDPEWLHRIRTNIAGDNLRIEQDSVVVSRTVTKGAVREITQTFYGAVHNIQGHRGSVQLGTVPGNFDLFVSNACNRSMVAIVLPNIAAISIQGSADVTLFDLEQDELELKVSGSGDIEASGKVQHLEIDIAGSGDVDVRELVAQQADISVAGSGDVDAMVKQAVRVRITGSGDVQICGNPIQRDIRVSGSGDARFQ